MKREGQWEKEREVYKEDHSASRAGVQTTSQNMGAEAKEKKEKRRRIPRSMLQQWRIRAPSQGVPQNREQRKRQEHGQSQVKRGVWQVGGEEEEDWNFDQAEGIEEGATEAVEEWNPVPIRPKKFRTETFSIDRPGEA